MIYPDNINSHLFKKKKDNLIKSKEINKLNDYLDHFCNLKIFKSSKEVIDSNDLKKANSLINEICKILNALKP